MKIELTERETLHIFRLFGSILTKKSPLKLAWEAVKAADWVDDFKSQESDSDDSESSDPPWSDFDWAEHVEQSQAEKDVDFAAETVRYDSTAVEAPEHAPAVEVPDYMQPKSSVLPPPPKQQMTTTLNLPKLSEGVRKGAWDAFKKLCVTWATNFGVEGKEQPDRLEALREIGTGPHVMAILIMAYEVKSLQQLVFQALSESNVSASSLDFCDSIAANMVQISHLAFPDLAGTYDYSTKWRRG